MLNLKMIFNFDFGVIITSLQKFLLFFFVFVFGLNVVSSETGETGAVKYRVSQKVYKNNQA